MKRISITLASFVVGTAFTAGAAVPASAAEATELTAEMVVTGYDPEVAKENGYRIVADANGVESSIPISAAARAEQADAAKGARVTKPGNCGTSTLTIKSVKSRGGINIHAAYKLNPGKKSFGHFWKVSGQSRLGTPFTENFSGANNIDSSWSATHFRSLYGFSSGVGSTFVGSHAKLTNGAVCNAKIFVVNWK